MFTKIIQDTEQLSNGHDNRHNTFEVLFKNVNDTKFRKYIKKFVDDKRIWDKITIEDTKEYTANGMILNIYNDGTTKCMNKKMLRYIKYTDKQLNLYNLRKTQPDNFPTTMKYYSVFTKKTMVFSKDGIDFHLVVKTDEDKEKTVYYDVKVIYNQSSYRYLNAFSKYFQ